MTVTLEPMSAERFILWNGHFVARSARHKIGAGTRPEDGALERSARENPERLG